MTSIVNEPPFPSPELTFKQTVWAGNETDVAVTFSPFPGLTLGEVITDSSVRPEDIRLCDFGPEDDVLDLTPNVKINMCDYVKPKSFCRAEIINAMKRQPLAPPPTPAPILEAAAPGHHLVPQRWSAPPRGPPTHTVHYSRTASPAATGSPTCVPQLSCPGGLNVYFS